MAQVDNVQAHRVEPPEIQPCEGALGAGIFAAQMDIRAGRHTVGADTYAGRSCKPPETYKSVDDLLAAEKSRLADNKPTINEFALPAQSDPKAMERMVHDSISGLENALGSARLDYVWFNDESGNAQVFILGKGGKKSDLSSQKTSDSSPQRTSDSKPQKTCVDSDSLVDDSANLQHNVPRGTTQGELGKILKERSNQAERASMGIPINATEQEVEAIRADRLLQLKALEDRLPAPENRSHAQKAQLESDQFAIEMGMPLGSSNDEITKAMLTHALELRAIMFGLDQHATAGDVKAVEDRIQATPDLALNEKLGLPALTTLKDAQELSMKRVNDGLLVERGLSPDLTPQEVSKILKERARQSRELELELIFPENLRPEEVEVKQRAIEAIRIGLPPTSSSEEVMEAFGKYHLQSLAVNLGLDRYATKAEIDAAEKRGQIKTPDNLCEVKPSKE